MASEMAQRSTTASRRRWTNLLVIWTLFITSSVRWPVATADSACDSLCDCHVLGDDAVVVHCSSKSLNAVPPHIPTNTTALDLSFNEITTVLRRSFQRLPRLQRLDMHMSNVEQVEEEAFSELTALEEIHLDHNLIRHLPTMCFNRVSPLHLLSLDHNRLRSLEDNAFSGLRLTSLNLQDNNDLSYIAPAVFYNSSVETLSLNRCSLETLPPTTLRPLLPSLKNVMWSYSLKPLTIHAELFAGFNINMLNLVDNGIQDLSFLESNFTVTMLDVSENPLGPHVDLGAYQALASTETLVLRGCNITTISTTRSLPRHRVGRLHELDLSDNLLTSLDSDLILQMLSLRRLVLSNNLISVPSSYLKPVFSHLDTLDLTGTPLLCDCRTEWLRLEVQANTVTHFRGLRCSHGLHSFQNSTEFSCISPKIDDMQSSASNSGVVVVSCTATGVPSPDVYWKYQYSSLVTNNVSHNRDESDPYRNSSQVLIDNVEECVTIQCIADNMLGREYKNLQICGSNSTAESQEIGLHGVNNDSGITAKIGYGLGGTLIGILIFGVVILVKHQDVQAYTKNFFRKMPMRAHRYTSTSDTCLVEEEHLEE